MSSGLSSISFLNTRNRRFLASSGALADFRSARATSAAFMFGIHSRYFLCFGKPRKVPVLHRKECICNIY